MKRKRAINSTHGKPPRFGQSPCKVDHKLLSVSNSTPQMILADCELSSHKNSTTPVLSLKVSILRKYKWWGRRRVGLCINWGQELGNRALLSNYNENIAHKGEGGKIRKKVRGGISREPKLLESSISNSQASAKESSTY